jgi:hypothetical protein
MAEAEDAGDWLLMGIVIPRLRQSARGQCCAFMLPGCDGGYETTVLAHAPSEVKATATKSDDFWSAYACYSCHNQIDLHKLPPEAEAKAWLRAIQRTQRIWYQEGLMEFPVREAKPKQSGKILARRHIGSGERL